MKRALFAVLTLAALTLAAGCRQRPHLETRTFALHHLSPQEALKLVEPYVYTDRKGDPGMETATPSALTVRETADNLDKISRVLKEYDAARPDVRLHFQLIQADDFKGSDPRIAPVERQLRKIFQFRGYRLAGEAYVEATDRTPITQRFQGTDTPYELQGWVQWMSSTEIQLRAQLTAPGYGTLLQTTVNLRPGQTLVLGSSPKMKPAGTLLLVVKADSTAS